jgi:thermitase
MTNRNFFLRLVFVLFLFFIMVEGVSSAMAERSWENGMTNPTDGEFVPGELLVKFKTEVSSSLSNSLMIANDANYVRTLYGSPVQLWHVEEGNETATIEALNANPNVEYAEPNHIYYAFDTTPNDPGFTNQWAHNRIESKAAWDISTGSISVTIAIIDSGIDETHPDFAGKLVSGYDFIDVDDNPHDGNGHGTHVAGIAAAATNNSVGIAGVSWGARIMPIRVLGNTGSGTSAGIVSGINWAYQHGADVLNLSLGGTSSDQTMQDAVTAAHNAGSLVVAAMGNCRVTNSSCPTANPTMYPAAYDNVMAVASTGRTDVYSYFSEYGSHCDISAPGGEMAYLHDPYGIYSTMPTYSVYLNTAYGYSQNYDYLQGTSQAAPHVSGLAALIWSLDPSLTPDQVQSFIETTADDLGPAGWDQDYGHGRINAAAALTAVQDQQKIFIPLVLNDFASP